MSKKNIILFFVFLGAFSITVSILLFPSSVLAIECRLFGDINGDEVVDANDADLCSAHAFDVPAWSQCDLNGDDKVDIKDLAIVAKHVGKTDCRLFGDINGDEVVDANDADLCSAHMLDFPIWSQCDLNGDDKVDIKDLAIVAKHVGKTDCRLFGDINGDEVVDANDLNLCSTHFGENWAQCDLNGDNKMDMKDLVAVNKHVGATCPFDFSLSNSGDITVAQGESGSNTITVDYTDGAGATVTLSISGLPPGATANFAPGNTCTSDCSRTLTISTPAEVALGTYPITVTGADGGLSRSTTFNLIVKAAPPPAVCGNNIREEAEQCDGTDDAACPGQCQADCTCPPPPPPPAECTPADVILVIDKSGSMNLSADGITRIDAAKGAATTFTSLLLPVGTANGEAVVAFSNSADFILSWSNSTSVIDPKIASISAGGCTNYIDALDKTLGLLGTARAEANKVVIFLSDGKPECSGQAPPYNPEQNKANAVKAIATLYTIGFAITPGSPEQTLLRAMATSPSDYFETSDAATLEAIYKEIFLNINDTDGDGFLNGACPGGDDWNDNNACVNPGGFEGIIPEFCGSCPAVGSRIEISPAKYAEICTAQYFPDTKICAINCNDNSDNNQDGLADIEDPNCPVPAGLVPCGRHRDAAETVGRETDPCTLCHLFLMFKRIVDFLILYVITPIGILMFVVGGAMLLTAAGDPRRISGGTKILTAAVIGILIFLLAWVIVNTIITFITTGGIPGPGQIGQIFGKPWNQIDCPVGGAPVCP